MGEQKFRIAIDPQTLVPRAGVRKFYGWSLLMTVLIAAAIALGWRYLPDVVPLLFTEPWGEARLVPKPYLFLLPATSLVTAVVNILIGQTIPKENRALSYALGVGTLMVNIMLLIALYGIAQSLI